MPMSLRVAPTHQPTLKQKQTLVYQHLLLLRSKTDCYRYVEKKICLAAGNQFLEADGCVLWKGLCDIRVGWSNTALKRRRYSNLMNLF